MSRDVGRTKRPINPANGGIAIIPRHCDALLSTPHSSKFLRVRGNAQSHPFGAGSRFRAPCSRSALPTYIKGLLSDSLRESLQKIGIADRPEAGRTFLSNLY
ncbi:MAG: hypothetical protein ABSE95_05070 [Thermodesulfobacteriota bacterium]